MGNEQSTPQENLVQSSILEPKKSASTTDFDIQKTPITVAEARDTETQKLPPKIDSESKKPTMEDLNRSTHTVFGTEHTWNDIPEKALSSSSKSNNFRMKKSEPKYRVPNSLPTFVPETK